jgi:hypothetical protein
VSLSIRRFANEASAHAGSYRRIMEAEGIAVAGNGPAKPKL